MSVPLSNAAPGAPDSSKTGSAKKQAAAAFSIMQRADDPDLARAARQLKADIAGGATGVAVIFAGAHNAYGFGLPPAAKTLEILFDGVDLTDLHIRIDNHPHGLALTEACVEFLQKRRAGVKTAKTAFGIDPAAALATTGRLKMSLAALKASLPQSMSAFFSSGLPGIVLEADGRLFHNAGAGAALEIGIMLSAARGHLHMVEDGRHHIAYALPHIGFATALDQDPAQGIAKLRVLQGLWHRLQRDCGVNSPVTAPIHVESSMRMMTARDCFTNITRGAAAAAAAVAGGAASADILPYSLPLGLPDEQARREARNALLVFTREAAPSDLFSGSALAPNAVLTEKLAAAAWAEFELLERQGGILQSLVDGKLQNRIREAQDLSIAACLKTEQNCAGTAQDSAAKMKKANAKTLPGEKGIYAQEPVAFAPQGIKHCAPLIPHRLESLLEEARAKAAAAAGR